MLKKCGFLLSLLTLSILLLPACAGTSVPPVTTPANIPNAVMLPALRAGGRATLVYFVTSYSSRTNLTGVLRRYDPGTRQSVDVLRLPDTRIEEAQISADGQWIVYVGYVVDHDELRLVRIDGRYAQTLLSAPPYAGISNVQWSPDQKQIVFAEQPPQTGPQIIYLLAIGQRRLQAELTSASQPGSPQYVPRKWLDNMRVLVTDHISAVQNSAFQHIALLDTRKGGHQQSGDLQIVYSAGSQCGDFDTSADATQLFILSCGAGTPSSRSSTLSVQSLSSGVPHIIFHSSTLFVTQIRQLTPQSLLLISGLAVWSIHSDGTGLTQLFAGGDLHGYASFCQFSRYPWSNFARDGSFFALETIEMGTDTHSSVLEVGSPSGGPLQTVASSFVGLVSPGSDVYLVGWGTL